MKRTSIALAVAALLAGCGDKEDKPVPTASPTYSSAKEADAAVPPELRIEHQHMLECEMKSLQAAGKEPEVSKELIMRITDDVKAGKRANPNC